MVELVLTLNDRDGKYAKHAAVVLASIFSNVKQTINVHILHDETLTEEGRLKLAQLAKGFHHYIFFYHVTVPEDMLQASAQVHKIDHWTKASMYRLLLPNILQADRVIYVDCDVWVNMDISELWNIDLGECYLGAILDQGKDNLGDYFLTMGLNGDVYFNSGVILFHLDNIRKKETWYDELLHFLRHYPATTMPDQDALNFIFGSNYMQLDQRFNTFAHDDLDPVNKIVHFAGEDSKWWDDHSPAAPMYQAFLAMTPWAETCTPAPAANPQCGPQKECAAVQPPVIARPETPAPETRPVNIHPGPPASAAQPVVIQPQVNPVPPIPVRFLPQIPATPVKPKRRRKLRLRLRPGLRKRRITCGKCRSCRSIRKLRRSKRQHVLRRKARPAARKSPVVMKKIIYVIRGRSLKKSSSYLKRSS
ncbi:glycosyltransferase [Paenibacillus jiagnxiensis]|uniref:glycosyltransferase n=1 Tax=Paenibacillus jiagnxiensis TaxID=3228926 RepID=UPI0033B0DA04